MKKQTVLVLGAAGMLGHVVWRTFREHPGYLTLGNDTKLPNLPLVFEQGKPDIVINCAGVVPRSLKCDNLTRLFEANAVLPHRLHAECRKIGARLIHISTDCVFSGLRGNYNEQDTTEPQDLYGKSKLLGEVDAKDAITIRTSLIGPELDDRKRGLLEWFLSQKGLAGGYANAFFSGLTTLEFANVLRDHVVPNPLLGGIFHVGGDRISKYDLLCGLKAAYDLDVDVAKNNSLVIDRSLNSADFKILTGYKAPSWIRMILEMRNAST